MFCKSPPLNTKNIIFQTLSFISFKILVINNVFYLCYLLSHEKNKFNGCCVGASHRSASISIEVDMSENRPKNII